MFYSIGTTLEKGGVVSHPSIRDDIGSGNLLVFRITGARGNTAKIRNDHTGESIHRRKNTYQHDQRNELAS